MDERAALIAIDDKLAQLWRWWNNPASFRQELVKPQDAPERNELAHAENHDLREKLEAAQIERDKLHSLVMQRMGGIEERIKTLTDSLELLRKDFLAQLA